MKYNQLADYRQHLEQKLTSATATSYYHAMCQLLADQQILDCKDLDIAKVFDKLKDVKYKNAFSKYKNALFKFCEFANIELDTNTIAAIESMHAAKKKRRRKLEPKRYDDIKNKINATRDIKLRLSFETMLNAGFRVSEISQIEKDDCTLHYDSISIKFIGKGRKERTVTISKKDNTHYFNKLVDLIQQTESGNKVFYSSGYLQCKAKEKGFECHDLRRAFSKMEYKKNKDMKEVQESLGHSKRRTTKIYTNSKIEID